MQELARAHHGQLLPSVTARHRCVGRPFAPALPSCATPRCRCQEFPGRRGPRVHLGLRPLRGPPRRPDHDPRARARASGLARAGGHIRRIQHQIRCVHVWCFSVGSIHSRKPNAALHRQSWLQRLSCNSDCCCGRRPAAASAHRLARGSHVPGASLL